jgi:hypothetical protein
MGEKLRDRFVTFLLAGALAVATVSPLLAQRGEQEVVSSMPKVGETAPDFTLHYIDGNTLKEVSLSQYRGKKNVVVAFFLFAFTGG